ncbi:ATP-dependent RNA helicase DbpA [Aliidiomarina celeris]|uniref:ATP-dependent RNA helicase DbpA n=1 Tax=Aliidiomarina celeris TaxID=2249428 RepID=UPI000DEBB8BB|nr:ATP-dependent RNA helicase DbpA [Aliidiomarina celeris]
MATTDFSNLDFSTLGLSSEQLTTLQGLGYSQMTAVQAESLPAILAGQDVIAQAKTGSGKTAAFGLGLIAKLEPSDFSVQALVLCPTRELAEQVAEEIRRLARNLPNIKVLTLCGGVPARAQIQSLEHGAHVIVGTPGRVLDHLGQNRIDLSSLKFLVLDEADRMLDMGFADDMKRIIQATPAERQTLLFSATFPAEISAIAKAFMQSPKHVEIEQATDASLIEQFFYQVSNQNREDAVIQLLLDRNPSNAILFCNTKRSANALYTLLRNYGFSVRPLHGDLEQREREQNLMLLNNGSVRIVVATDVAARGLDIKALDLVLNVEMAHDTETHIHRVGRTGRAGEKGLALTLLTSADDYKFSLLQEAMPALGDSRPLPKANASSSKTPEPAAMATIQIMAGKKDKIRPGDIVGALTSTQQISAEQVGKIAVQAQVSYVAVEKNKAKQALNVLTQNKLKGRRCRAHLI